MICRIINVEVKPKAVFAALSWQITELSADCAIVTFTCMQLTNHSA